MAVYAFGQDQITNRIALVIGVQKYSHVTPLQHSLNDAHDMAAVLKSKNFKVFELYEPQSKKEIQDYIRRYYNALQGQPNTAGLLYYSGHGIQVDGSNFIIPANADPQIKADLDDQCVKMDFVMQALEEAGNPLNILILDACRNNPFRGFSRSTSRGLNSIDAPKGSYVVYATKPGSVASDGTGRNGLFTSKLLKYINEPNLNIEQVFKLVARDVSAESGEAQRPWITSDYTGDFYFSGSPKQSGGNVSQTPKDPVIEPGTVTRSVENLSADDMYRKGKDFYSKKNYAEAVDWLEKAAAQGQVQAQTDLAEMYDEGRGVKQDYERARTLYLAAAERENPKAQNNLAMIYASGNGVDTDYEEAMKWYMKAAKDHQYVDSQYNLAVLYLNGRGVAKNESEAILWFKRAADQGDVRSQTSLGSLFLMGGDQTSRNKAEAIFWFKKAAAQGDAGAKETLSNLGIK